MFFFNNASTTEIYTLSLHDALPIWIRAVSTRAIAPIGMLMKKIQRHETSSTSHPPRIGRSEEHTSELQSRQYLVCRLLLEKKNEHHDDVAYLGQRDPCPRLRTFPYH